MNSLNYKKYSQIFLKSLQNENNQFIKTEEVLDWIIAKNNEVLVDVKQIPIKNLSNWHIDTNFSKIFHESGHFFSIKGINVETNYGKINSWSQPIIDQPEVGILGFLTKEFNGILHFLVQAKIEPGNINSVQISPTLQATKINYTQKHKGALPKYLSYFLEPEKHEIIYNQLQSEQGARFLKKLNRNIIIKVKEDIKLERDFIWLTLGQIKKLSLKNNIINMDTRTVVSCINYRNTNQLYDHSLNDSIDNIKPILNWLNQLKKEFTLRTKIISLADLQDWETNDHEIVRHDKKFFKVIGADIKIENREVKSWQQPLIKPMDKGIVALFTKKINNEYHYLVNAKVECGHADIVELGPTISSSSESLNDKKNISKLLDIISKQKYKKKIFDTLQSEEGGRFFHEENRNILVEVEDIAQLDDENNYRWISLNQILYLLNYSNIINIQLRSLISIINE